MKNMGNDLKASLRGKETIIGTIVTLPSTEVAEMMSLVGWDYLWIDTEHTTIDFTQAQRMVQAVGGRCPCLIRIPDNNEVWIKKALDIGCQGIVVPQVKTAEEAQRVVDSSLYPPEGKRSVGVSRAHDYGMSFQEYVQKANESLVIVLQVEQIEGVKNIEAIARVPGIDAILIGPLDLSGSLGVIGQIEHPQLQEAIGEVKRTCGEAGVSLGIFAADSISAKHYVQQGFNLIALNLDIFYLWRAAKASLEEVRVGANLRSRSGTV
jgi:2-keto-3-deoxy-L-rhamnonate aldolase RhmA